MARMVVKSMVPPPSMVKVEMVVLITVDKVVVMVEMVEVDLVVISVCGTVTLKILGMEASPRGKGRLGWYWASTVSRAERRNTANSDPSWAF